MGWGSRAEVSGSATPNVVIVAHGATPFVRDVRFRENWVALSTVGSWPRAVRHWRPLTTHTRRMRFSGPLTGVLCKRPFPEFVAKIRIQRQRSSADIYRSCEQNCNRPAAFKNATVRERPIPASRVARKQTFNDQIQTASSDRCTIELVF